MHTRDKTKEQLADRIGGAIRLFFNKIIKFCEWNSVSGYFEG